MTVRAASLLVLTFLASAAPAAPAHPLCQPGPEAVAVVGQVGSAQAMIALPPEEWHERLGLVEAAIAEHPDDLFLHRQRQDLYNWAPKDVREEGRPRLAKEYEALRDQHPADPVFLYLHARMADDREVRREAYTTALETDPDFPWAHLGLATVAIGDAADAKKEAEAAGEAADAAPAEHPSVPHLTRFLELCPDGVWEVLVNSHGVDAPAFWAERLPGFRERIRAAPADHLRALPRLWELEFRLAELAEHEAVRGRIAADLAAVEALGAEDRETLDVLKHGYELAGRVEKAEELEARIREAEPCAQDAVSATLGDWSRENHPDRPGISEEERRGATAAYVEETARWIERCPDAYSFWAARMRALAGADDTPDAEVAAAADRVAELYAQWRGHSFPSGYEQAAEALIDRRLEPGRALDLLARAEAEVTKRREGQAKYLEDLPEEERRQMERSNAYSDWSREVLAARAQVLRGEHETADELLAALATRLEELEPGEEAQGREGLAHAGYVSALWEARAELAEARGRAADAIAYLLRAASATPSERPYWLQGPRPDQARERAAELWAGLGGTEEGLAALERAATGGAGEAAALADFSPWEEASEPLPAFELADLSGKIWKLGDLQGKTVFANAWATWCGPCREELPAVQALHERLADRDDVVVVTLNMDRNPGAVAPYLTKEGFTFPVLMAFDYLTEEKEVFGIPQSWILDGTGTVRYEQSGYDASLPEEDWIAEVEAKLEAAAAAEPAEAAAGTGG